MAQIQSNHPEFKRYGTLDMSAFPERIDYVINFVLSDSQVRSKPYRDSVEKKAMEILGQTTADGDLLTDSHNWKMYLSDSWTGPQKLTFYLVGTPKNQSVRTNDTPSTQLTMKTEEFKKFINECVVETIQELAADPTNQGFEKLRFYMQRFPSFIPDAITYMKDKEDAKVFDIVARETDEKQYVILVKGVDEATARNVAGKIKDLHIKNLEVNIKRGAYKLDRNLERNAKSSLDKLKIPSGSTGMVYKKTVAEDDTPPVNTDGSLMPEPKRRKMAQKELVKLRSPSDRYPSVIQLVRSLAEILEKWGFDAEQLRRKYVANDMEPDVLFGQGGSVQTNDNFRVGDKSGFTISVYKDQGQPNFEVVYYLS